MVRPVVLASVVAYAGAGRSKVDMESANAIQVVDTIASLLDRQHEGIRRLAEAATAQATPGAENHFKASLKKVVDKIDGTLQPQVKEAQEDAQDSINEAFAAAKAASAAAGEAKADADKADSAWFSCVARELEMKEFHETAQDKLEAARKAEQEACSKQEQNKGFKFAAGDSYKLGFKCDNEVEGSCKQQMASFKSHTVDKMLRDAKAQFQANKRYYDDLETDCKKKRAERVAAEEAVAAADDKHESHQDKCAAVKRDRTKKICEYGDTVQAKGVGESKFKQLIALIEGSGTPESESDRVQEWATLETSSCMIKRSLELGMSSPVSAADMKACKEQTSALTRLDKKAGEFDSVTKSHACKAGQITFANGEEWGVSGNGDSAADYSKQSFRPAFNPSEGQQPFKMCPQDNEDSWRPVVNDKLASRGKRV